MKSETSHKIRNRENSNDVFITPLELAKKGIEMIEYNNNEIWLDPFKNSGNYYNQYPNENKKWCEILEKKDFFNFNEKVDIICSNPPYSILGKVLEKSIELKPRIIQYLIGMGNLTTKRIEMMEDAGYGLTKIHMCKVYKWYGMSFIVQFEKDKKSIISYNRKIWK